MLGLHAANLTAVPHSFFTRRGGVSEGIFSSLNCGYGSQDAQPKVRENRSRVAGHFGQTEAQLITLYQVHSAQCVTVEASFPDAPQADALVTRTPGLVLGILTADCAPVLFADAQAGIIGAAHAGWKGAFSGVLEATIDAMQALGARNIAAAIGPCIAQKSYEVGPEFADRIGNTQFFTAGQGDRLHFDLRGYAAHRLRAAGVSSVDISPRDTCAEEDDFFSFRRATLRAEPSYGRQISCISLM